MAFDTTIKEFAEFMGSEIKRVETGVSTGGSQSTIPIIYGAGRPDKPDTTDGKIKDNEPNGTVYISSNGAGVGAWKWIKAKGIWQVVYGDTGDITLRSINTVKGNLVKIRRYNNLVIVTFGGGPWGWFQALGKGSAGFFQRKRNTRNIDIITLNGIPQGFRTDFSLIKPFYNDNGIELGKLYIGGKGDSNYLEMRFLEEIRNENYTDLRFPDLMWYTTEPFPDTLP